MSALRVKRDGPVLRVTLAKPEPRRSQVGFKLGHASIERRFPAIDLAQTLAKMAGKLGDLELQLLAVKLNIFARNRGNHLGRRLFNFQHGLSHRDRVKRCGNVGSLRLVSGARAG